MNFILPGFYNHKEMYKKFLNFFYSHKQYFLDNCSIHAIYGNFPYTIWDGGRTFSSYSHATQEEIEELVAFYNKKYNIPIRLIFTNSRIEEKHLHDRFSNIVLELCHNDLNEIVVNSLLLENYIRNNFPKYKIISSTTKCLANPKDSKEELNKNYEMICFDYNLNKNQNFLNSLNLEEKEKSEILVNAICPPHCPSRKEHYNLNSYSYLNYGSHYKTRTCGIYKDNLYPDKEKEKNNLSQEECIEYSKKGFNNFKLEGRTFSSKTLLLNLVKYMVKPEYQFHVLNQLL